MVGLDGAASTIVHHEWLEHTLCMHIRNLEAVLDSYHQGWEPLSVREARRLQAEVAAIQADRDEILRKYRNLQRIHKEVMEVMAAR